MRWTAVFLLFLLIHPALWGQVQIEPGKNSVQLIDNPAVKKYIANKSVSFDEVRDKLFVLPYLVSDEPTEQNVIWLRFNLLNAEQEPQSYFLFVNTPYFNVYKREGQKWKEEANGRMMNYPDRTVRTDKTYLPIELNAGETAEIYVRLQGSRFATYFGHPTIGNHFYYFEQIDREHAETSITTSFSLVYLSGMVIIFIFILMLYLMTREEVYRYYILFLIFQILYGVTVTSRTPPEVLNFLAYYPIANALFMETFIFTFIGFYVLFILSLLEISRQSVLGKTLVWLARACFAYGFAYLILSFFNISPAQRDWVSDITRMIILPLNLIFVIWIVIKVKHPLVIYLILAHLFFFVGAVLSFLISYMSWYINPRGVFYFKNSVNVVFQAGLFGEAISFSLILAYRVRLILRDRHRSVKAYIEQLRETEKIQERMNEALDKKVEEKTTELISLYNEMEKQKEKELEREFSQKIKDMEMLALRNQMNPHFLFNSMNAIKHLIFTDRREDAMSYLDDFSTLLRKVLQSSRKKTVSVEEELENLELYLSLEEARLGKDFHFKIEMDDRSILSQYDIPGLILQPFVENAIWHGLNPSLKSEKNLIITFETDPTLVISIYDNGIGRESSLKMKAETDGLHKSMGLEIAGERLELYNLDHSNKISLDITDLEENGVASGTLVKFTYSS